MISRVTTELKYTYRVARATSYGRCLCSVWVSLCASINLTEVHFKVNLSMIYVDVYIEHEHRLID